MPDYLRSLYIAYGSVCELETQLLMSGDLNFIESQKLKTIHEDIREVERMLKALISHWRERSVHLIPRCLESPCNFYALPFLLFYD